MNLSLRDIEYFLAAVEHGHLERAAAACGVSQPALSKSLRRLEADTGLALMQRHGRGLRLSSEGLVFLQHANKLWAEYRDAVRHAMELRMGEAGLLRVGATGVTVDSVVMPALRRLLPRRPALRLQLTQGLSDDLNQQVERGGLDLAVTPVYADGPATLLHEIMFEDGLCVAASRRHPLAARARLHWRDLAGQRWILPRPTSVVRRMLDARFAEAGLTPPAAALEVEHFSPGSLQLLAEGDMLAVLPLSALAGTVAVTPLPVALGQPLRRSIALISRRGTTWSPLMNEFREAVLACGGDAKAAAATRGKRA
ncbi:MAG: LysR family transcriptional regulator [Achromobacter pulmonis]|uniref:HTH-type transcriptional regulator HdfR n=1 Tax=Achromobacter pulmonis TaxID=1389932 RepID=A0A6S7E1E5_9BURK|nr:LysR family transcriptional regulator [Achromobacter pulmonis]MPT25706.1 LysR family transcriptional regulator [Achromobacter sp.]CAB3646827.1 HTH-type transcriptional regulator HdfR [Achromobacter pulmonis]CAB3892027.1 HTH-type transcriptional regulator HdfR [Achromobacter pulmonis]